MVKKKFPLKWGVVVVVLVAAVLLLNSAGLLATGGTTPAGSDYTVISLSEVDYVSKNAALNRAAYLATIVLKPTGEKIVGTAASKHFTASEVQSTAKEAEVGFTINADFEKSACSFPYDMTEAEPLYDHQIDYRGEEWPWESHLEAQCSSDAGVLWSGGGLPPKKKVFCWTFSPIKKFSVIGAGRYDFEVNFNFVSDKAGQQSIPVTLNNLDKQVASYGSLAQISWTGNLMGNEACDLDYWVARDIVGGRTYIADPTSMTLMPTLPSMDKIETCLNEKTRTYYATVETQIQTCVASYNNIASRIGTEVTVADITTQPTTVYSGRVIQPKAPTTQPMFPQVQLVVDANWLGVRQFQGKPQIVSAVADAFNSGTPGAIRGVVKNIGSDDGTFQISATCTSGISADPTSAQVLQGEQENFAMNLRGTCDSTTITGNCALLAKDSRGGGQSTFNVPVVCKPNIDCTPYTEGRCVGNDVWTCNGDGVFKFTKTCPENCIVENNLGTCKSVIQKCGNGICEAGIGETATTCVADCGGNQTCDTTCNEWDKGKICTVTGTVGGVLGQCPLGEFKFDNRYCANDCVTCAPWEKTLGETTPGGKKCLLNEELFLYGGIALVVIVLLYIMFGQEKKGSAHEMYGLEGVFGG